MMSIAAVTRPGSRSPGKPILARWLLALGACAVLTGCLNFLKPSRSNARHFVLAPLPAAEGAGAGRTNLAVGLGPVKLPAYLYSTSLAIRKNANEIAYQTLAVWAERLDSGIQRVLAANLAVLLPTERVRLAAWRPDDVAVELHVTIEQFDVDSTGRGVLVARWRVVASGGEVTLKTGESRLVRQGLAPEADPAIAVATLSELVADLGRQLAEAIGASAAPRDAR